MGRKEISEQQFRDDPDAILLEAAAGRAFVITRDGEPIASLSPLPGERRVDVAPAVVASILATPIDTEDFQADLDAAEAPVT